MRTETLCAYEAWEIASPDIPARSRLFYLEPMGLGTGYVESLTSYTTRLAEAHSLSPSTLLGKELSPIMHKSYWIRGGARSGTRGSALSDSFHTHTKAINGTGIIAIDWVDVLERLTLYKGLQCLTMLPWSTVLSQRHLVRSRRAWCSLCYEEWHGNGSIIYEPLLWTLRSVKICLQHKQLLADQCLHCESHLPWLSRRSRAGYCSKCGEWLGANVESASTERAFTETELAWQIWVVKNLEELIIAISSIPPPPRARITKAITTCINQIADGVMNRFASLIGKRKTTVWGWKHGKTNIPIGDLLRICYCAGISVVNFIKAEFILSKQAVGTPQIQNLILNELNARRSPRPLDKDRLCLILTMILNSEWPPPSMQEVSKRLDYDKRVLYKHFSTLCRAISSRFRKYQKEQYEKMREQYRKEIRQAALKLHSCGIYPSEQRVSEMLKNPNSVHIDIAGAELRMVRYELGLAKATIVEELWNEYLDQEDSYEQ